MLLPATVPGRMSDIWRSYFAQCIFADAGLRLVFAPPKISQIRNDHNILGDLSAENDLYRKCGKLIDFLANWDSEQSSIPERMEQLWIDLYERGYIEIEDVEAVQMWLNTLKQIEYKFPPLKRRFRNVAVMGQFNYADSTNLYDEVIFWTQKHREHFDTVIAAGPFSKDQVHVLEKNSIQTITPSTQYKNLGFYAPFENLMNTLKRFETSTKIEGVLYVHDDALMNVTELSQSSYPFPTKDIIGNNISPKNNHDDMSYADVRTFADRQGSSDKTIVQIASKWNLRQLNKTVYAQNLGPIAERFENFYDGRHHLGKQYCSGAQVKMAKDPASAKYRQGDGSLLFPSYSQSDFLFVPTKYSGEFAEAASLHLKHRVFLECAIPKIVDIIRQQTNAEVRVVKLCTAWTRKRGKPEMIDAKCKPKGKFGIAHPMKISGGLERFSEQMDRIQFQYNTSTSFIC